MTLINRARSLGCSYRARRQWQEEELELLREHAGAMLSTIQRRLTQAGHHRTRRAIAVAMLRHGLSTAVDDPDLYRPSDLGQLMGVNERTVLRWIEAGMLAATDEAAHAHKYISRVQARNFLMQHVGMWDHRAVDPIWMVDLLGRGTRR